LRLSLRPATHAGSSEWEAILTEAIESARQACITATKAAVEGELVGVFCRGSPAIARKLQRVAQQIMANHQYATRMHSRAERRVNVDCWSTRRMFQWLQTSELAS
jgi:hypothetical protein